MKSRLIVIAAAIAALVSISAKAQETENVKTGLNFGPLPAVAYDADKGFQLGALLNIYNYGDGSSYPYYKSKWYLGGYYFTKGSQAYDLMYDRFNIFPGVRFAASLKYEIDKAFDFYGFNGYGAFYDHTRIDAGAAGVDFPFHPFYRRAQKMAIVRADFIGEITENLHWTAGYHFKLVNTGTIDYASINQGKPADKVFPATQPTLFDYYQSWGIISAQDAKGGIISALRAGIEYDTRDKEGAPSRGIWADAHINYAPSWLGTTAQHTTYVLNWRQYLPLVGNDVLTFAYRLNYQGTIGNYAPYYAMNYLTVLGSDNDFDGMGGYKTTRGIMRARNVGLDTALWTAELRWRFLRFQFINQNFAIATNIFTDGSVVTRKMKTDYNPVDARGIATKALYDTYVLNGKDAPHITFGAGLRFIMNENFIVAFEYGTPLSHFMKNSAHYNQDGSGAFYINMGYLF